MFEFESTSVLSLDVLMFYYYFFDLLAFHRTPIQLDSHSVVLVSEYCILQYIHYQQHTSKKVVEPWAQVRLYKWMRIPVCC